MTIFYKAAVAALLVTLWASASAFAATFNLISSGTVGTLPSGSIIPSDAAYTLDVSFDPEDVTLISGSLLAVTNVTGTFDIAGIGTFAIDDAKVAGISSPFYELRFSGPGFDLGSSGFDNLHVSFSDGTSPFGRSQVEYFRSITDDEVYQLDFRGTSVFTVTSLQFGEVTAPAAVPLPASLGLLLAGFAGLFGLRRRVG